MKPLQRAGVRRDSPFRSARRVASELWGDYQWLILGASWVIAFSVGYHGFKQHIREYPLNHAGARLEWGSIDCVILTLQLFRLGGSSVLQGITNGWLQAARILAPIVGLATVLTALVSVYWRQYRLIWLRVLKGHTIICGLGDRGFLLATGFADCDERVVAIDIDANNEQMRTAENRGILTLTGDARDRDLLRKVRAHRARYVVCVCRDDAANAEIGAQLRELVADNWHPTAKRSRPVTAVLHMQDPQLATFLRTWELGVGSHAGLRLEFVNLHEIGANAVIADHNLLPGVADQRSQMPHLVVVGASSFGRSFIVAAARKGRLASSGERSSLRITLVDSQAGRVRDALLTQYPCLENACSITAFDCEMGSPEFMAGGFMGQAGDGEAEAVLVCCGDDSRNLTVGFHLANILQGRSTKVIAQMSRNVGLASLISGAASSAGVPERLTTFGVLEGTCVPDMIRFGAYEHIARAIHEAYLLQVARAGMGPMTAPKAVAWEHLSESDKEENRLFASDISRKLSLVGCGLIPQTDWECQPMGFSPDEVEELAKAEHERWLTTKKSQRLRYDEERVEGRSHPHMRPWEELPAHIQEIDREMVRMIPAALAGAGLEICRVSGQSPAARGIA
jgi:voltage-gated potassium channel Kch